MGKKKSFMCWGGVAGILLIAVSLIGRPPQVQSAETYVWDNVVMGGGGYVVGAVVNPNASDLIYIRTDVGGLYRWDPDNTTNPGNGPGKWIAITDQFTVDEQNYYGGDGIATSASHPDIAYACLGKYVGSSGGIFKSTNRGATWTKVYSINDFGSNQGRKWAGECIYIDPTNPDRVFAGTRNSGLYRTSDGGNTWSRVSSVPNGAAGEGIRCVICRDGNTVYAGVTGSGVYRSTDGGNSFSLMSGSPGDPVRMALDSVGTLYVTGYNVVKKFNGSSWITITPPFSEDNSDWYTGISVDPNNDNHILCNARGSWQMNRSFWRSTNGGSTWTRYRQDNGGVTWINDIPWMPSGYFNSQPSFILFDPFHANRFWFGDWYAVYMGEDAATWPITVYTKDFGHEEIVEFDYACPHTGAYLLNGCADNGGLKHTDIYIYPTIKFGQQETTGIDFCEANPNYVARVSSDGWGASGFNFYISTNNGTSWTAKTSPGSNGKLAYSATDINNLVWIGKDAVTPKYTTNGGSSWSNCSGAPAASTGGFWNWHKPLASDRVNGSKFYIYDSGKLYLSTNGGANWSAVNSSLPTGASGTSAYRIVKAAPGKEGEVWVSLGTNGLHRSSDSGSTFTKITFFEQSNLIAFGKSMPGSSYATAFVYGKSGGQWGVYRSTDLGASWVKISLDSKPMGNSPNSMEGDRQVAGRVYIGTNGRGTYYGEPSGSLSTPTMSPTSTPTNTPTPTLSPTPTPTTTPVTYISAPKTLSVLNIDGNLNESVWTVGTAVSKAISGTPNNTVSFGALWDGGNLYVGVTVLDANLYNDSANAWDDDSVEIYIDGNHNHGTSYDTYDRQFVKGYNDTGI
ncbi:MAG: sugar-binding protein, partial [Bacillota bacterium]